MAQDYAAKINNAEASFAFSHHKILRDITNSVFSQSISFYFNF